MKGGGIIKRFKGFPEPPIKNGYTQVPNVVFDHIQNELNGSEFKVLMTAIRKIYGWLDDSRENPKTEDIISISQFMEYTGLSNKAVISSIRSLKEKGFLIEIEQTKKGKKYTFPWRK
ncbi:MAG: replication protein [archaeon]